ncbi:MAG: hypothetical protein HFG34_06655 [Eubacterium sp.]|nr:hypothetical protein [Eubacterium sp.]
MEQRLNKIIQDSEYKIETTNRKSNILGIVKLVLFAALVFTGVKLCFTSNYLGWGILAAAQLVLFVFTLIWHNRVLEGIQQMKGICGIASRDRKRLLGDWQEGEDDGGDLAGEEHPYARDLDIIGKRSLFQYINCTHTFHGRRKLAEDLLSPEYSIEEIEKRQQIIYEIGGDYEGAAHMEYVFSQIDTGEETAELLEQLKDQKPFSGSKWFSVLLNVMRGLTIAACGYLVCFRTNAGFALLGALLFIQFCLWRLGEYRTRHYLEQLRRASRKIMPYNLAVREVLSREFTAARGKELQGILAEAQKGMDELARISRNVGWCYNLLSDFLLNVIFLWNYKNAFALQNWKKVYGEKAEDWFGALGEMECYLSFANLLRSCSQMCAPEVTKENKGFRGVKLGHPLLSNKDRVCNDFEMEDGIVILSGSNMSGKSTFMRAVGINMVLARAGSWVCAEAVSCGRPRIMTSMRIVDRTTEGISTFYSELLRIRQIIDAAGEDEPVYFLIDEIFRGTNSVDRRKGAEGVIQKLCQQGCCGIITTHDLEICEKQKGTEGIKNYSFCEEYHDGEMYFTYTLQQGVAKTTNGEFLLKKVGIL